MHIILSAPPRALILIHSLAGSNLMNVAAESILATRKVFHGPKKAQGIPETWALTGYRPRWAYDYGEDWKDAEGKGDQNPDGVRGGSDSGDDDHLLPPLGHRPGPGRRQPCGEPMQRDEHPDQGDVQLQLSGDDDSDRKVDHIPRRKFKQRHIPVQLLPEQRRHITP